MANVVRNPDNTLTVTLTAVEQRLLVRWATETGRTPAAQCEDVVNGFLANKREDYRGLDGPSMRDKYEALTQPKQAQVDAILDALAARAAKTVKRSARKTPVRRQRSLRR